MVIAITRGAMRKDYRLYELNDDEFERFVVRICNNWLGDGVIPFAPGRDGGRDGKFVGTAQSFPSMAAPATGHFVVQAKHVSLPNKSCSDRDFEKLLSDEYPKLERLSSAGICDHYLVFTNRRLTGGAEEKIVAELLKHGPTTAHLIGVERLNLEIEKDAALRKFLPNLNDVAPFRFNQDELIEVIGAVHDYVTSEGGSVFDSAYDFNTVHIRKVKNPANGLSDEFYQDIIVAGSMPHFRAIEDFLKNPRNRELANLYHDAADELKQKIFLRKSEFSSFDEVFGFIYEEVQNQRNALRGKRKMISIILHYMYCNCDIGMREIRVGAFDTQC